MEAVGTGLDGWRFLWTHGVETEGPVLRDVPAGAYAAVPVGRAGAPPPVLVHRCAPAQVGVGRGLDGRDA